MNPETISRIIKLIDQTGDKVVMMDPATERAIVIMDLADYEELRAGQDSGSGRDTVVASERSERPAFAEPGAWLRPSDPVSDQATGSESPAQEPVSEEILDQTEPVDERTANSQPAEASVERKKASVGDYQKKPSIYANPGQRDPLAESAFSDLTQADLLDKINRDIAAWKTAQDRKRVDQLKSAVSKNRSPESADALEEEERFYLEPID